MFEEIDKKKEWIKIEPLNKGRSKDWKYHIYTQNG